MNNQLRAYSGHTYENQNPKVNYPDLYLLPFVSAAVGFLMVQLGTDRPWPVWDHDPVVRISILSSILCTATALFIIALFNRVLDWQLPWRRYLYLLPRLGAQYLLCVFIPNIVVAGWQYLFFNEIGVPGNMDGYMDENFPAVRWMLVIWNLLYVGCYYYSVHSQDLSVNTFAPTMATADDHATADDQAIAVSANKHKSANLYTPHDVVYWQTNVAVFLSENKKTTAYLVDGRTKVYPEPTKFFEGLVNNEQFYMVRSGKLVNKTVIHEVIDSGRYYRVVLKAPHDTLQINTVIDGKAAFKAWWGGPIRKED